MVEACSLETGRPADEESAGSSVIAQRLRRPVAVLLSRFPLITETFILREIIELERQGQPVRLVPLIEENPEVVHLEARPWIDRALYTPYFSASILRSNVDRLRRSPMAYWRLFRKMILSRRQRIGVRFRTLALFPKAVYLAERLQAEGIRHVHAHFATYPASVAHIIASLTDITYSLTVHAHDIFVGRELLEEKLSAAQWIRTISQFNKRFLVDLYPTLPADKLRVIHVGVELTPDRREPQRAEEDEDSPLVLCIAALKPYKGLSVLLQACRLLRDQGLSFRCEIIGRGPLRTSLQATIDRLGLSEVVRLVGPQPQHLVAQAIEGASVVVLPSIVAADGQMEGIPVALMEALAAGRPVVASAISGIPELIDTGVQGLLTKPGDHHELASALGSLLADAAAAEAMGVRGRERVSEEFELSTTVRQLLGRLDESNPELGGVAELEPKGIAESVVGDAAAGVRRIHRRRDSTVLELLLQGDHGPQEIIAKTHRSFVGESRPARVRATEEFRWLSFLHRSLEELRSAASREFPRLQVPRPLQLMAESATLTMERCRGESLLLLLRQVRGAWDGADSTEVVRLMRGVGKWLRTFQDVGAGTESGRDPQQYLRQTTQSALEGLESYLSHAEALRCRWRLEQQLDELDSRDLTLVARHGDFWPGNVFVETDHVEVIDFEGSTWGLAYEDVGDFVAHVELLFAYPLLRRRRRTLIRAFIEGYLDGTRLDPTLYQLCLSMALLKLLRHRPESVGVDALEAWRRYRLRNLVSRS